MTMKGNDMINFNWIQIFADAGTVVNTLVSNGTSNYTNAYTGEAVAASRSRSISSLMEASFSMKVSEEGT